MQKVSGSAAASLPDARPMPAVIERLGGQVFNLTAPTTRVQAGIGRRVRSAKHRRLSQTIRPSLQASAAGQGERHRRLLLRAAARTVMGMDPA